jgi:hypothetical protein
VEPQQEVLMSTEIVVILVLAALAIGAGAAWFLLKRRRSASLRRSFGGEYERTVQETGDRDEAERDLEHRRHRVEQLQIRPLPPGEADRYASGWQEVQKQFVDAPAGAVNEADRLVADVMQRRGYPMAEFEQRAADLSVNHPRVVENYRAAHRIAERTRNGGASTEDLRQAMVHYRVLFEDLLEGRTPTGGGAR